MVWDFRDRKVLQTLTTGAAPLECRWSLKEGANHGFTNCAFDDSIWVWEGDGGGLQRPQALRDRQAARRPAPVAGRPLPVRELLRSDEIQQWDVSDLKKPKLTSTLKPGVQPNMMHVTGDGKRMYITNSLLSTMDRSDKFWVRLAHVRPDGMKLDKMFDVDLTKFKTGPARGHDMLLN